MEQEFTSIEINKTSCRYCQCRTKDTDICFCCFVTETRLFSDSWSGAVGICFSYGCPIYLQYGLSCFSMGYNTKSVTADIKETIENLNITRCRWKQ